MSVDSFFNEKKPVKTFPPVERWGEYKGYTIWHNPPHGYVVMKENSQRMNMKRLDTPKAAQALIDTLPPHPTYKETLMKITGQRITKP